MAMSQSKLATELEAMTPTNSTATAIDRFATAWENYFAESTVKGISVTNGSLDNATDALKSAMEPVIATGPLAMANGIVAFWNVVATSAATIWITVPPLSVATPPPTLSAMQAAIAIVGTANIAGTLSLEDSAAAMAAAIHPNNLGGTATDTTAPTPIVSPIL